MLDKQSTFSMRRRAFAAALVVAALPVAALASPVDIPYSFANGGTILASEFNENFDAIADAVNDNDARIAALENAVTTNGVPSGTIAFFATGSCPAGWAEHADLRGRVPLGLPQSGTVSATVGAALGDEGTRTISQVPSHSHGVGTLAATTTSAGSHTHTMQNAGSHSHSLWLEAAGPYGTGYVMGTVNSVGGDVTSVPMSSAGSHAHTINSGGAHTHPVTLSGNTASAGLASVDVTMPYLQLLACAKV